MLDAELLKSRIVSVVEIVLQNKTGTESLSLLISKIVKMDFSPEHAQRSILRIRMGISLLISEELAEDIYEELVSLVRAASPDTPRE